MKIIDEKLVRDENQPIENKTKKLAGFHKNQVDFFGEINNAASVKHILVYFGSIDFYVRLFECYTFDSL